MSQELIRIVDGIARDKNIEKEQIYADIEQAVASGLRKHFNTEDTTEFQVTLDRVGGTITAARNHVPLDIKIVGRIGAQTVKQVMIQLIRQDERGSIYEEYKDRVGTIVTGTIARFEGGDDDRQPRPQRGDHAPERPDPRREPRRRGAHPGADHRGPRHALGREDHPQPQPPGADPPAVRAGGARGRRADDRDQGPGPRAGPPDEGSPSAPSTPRSTPSGPASASAGAGSRTSSTSWAGRRSTSSGGTSRARS